MPVVVKGCPADARWEMNGRLLEAAQTYLGLRYPVEVTVTGLRKAAGRYKGMREGKHQITVSRYLTCPATVGRTLWHEMTHAKQREAYRMEADFWRAYAADNLMEAAADASETLNERMPLCAPR